MDELGAVEMALVPFAGTAALSIVSPGHVALVVAELAQDDDAQLAAEACLSVLSVLWPNASPEDCGRADWWQTPLGRLCARSLGRDDSESVTQSVAAAMLGVTRGTIAQMLHRGNLDRHPDGGVLRSAVMARLTR